MRSRPRAARTRRAASQIASTRGVVACAQARKAAGSGDSWGSGDSAVAEGAQATAMARRSSASGLSCRAPEATPAASARRSGSRCRARRQGPSAPAGGRRRSGAPSRQTTSRPGRTSRRREYPTSAGSGGRTDRKRTRGAAAASGTASGRSGGSRRWRRLRSICGATASRAPSLRERAPDLRLDVTTESTENQTAAKLITGWFEDVGVKVTMSVVDIGAIMTSYHGGRSEVHQRRDVARAIYGDLLQGTA